MFYITYRSLKKNRPQQFATPGGRLIDFQYGAKMTIVLPISPVLLHRGPKFKCLYLCFRCLGTCSQCQNLRQGAAILDFKMTAICFTLLCISLPVALWKENKDSLYVGRCLLGGNCHHGRHIGIQDGRHIIRHAVFHDRQMSLTLSVVTEKVVISPFRSDLTRLPSKEHLRWQQTLLAYRESTRTILSVTFHYSMCNLP